MQVRYLHEGAVAGAMPPKKRKGGDDPDRGAQKKTKPAAGDDDVSALTVKQLQARLDLTTLLTTLLIIAITDYSMRTVYVYDHCNPR